MQKFGIIYSTVDGHTLEICERVQQRVEEAGYTATLLALTPDVEIDLTEFDRVVIGASIRYGKHRPEVASFVDDNAAVLAEKQSAFFSVNAVARKAGKNQADTNPYVRKFLSNIKWEPTLIGVFGGRINYAKYRFWDRTMIRFIMWMTKGPTNLDANVDFTDWEAVDRFAADIGKKTTKSASGASKLRNLA